MIHRDMAFQDLACSGVWFERNHSSRWSRPMTELECVDSNVGSYVEAHKAGLNQVAQEICHSRLVFMSHHFPLTDVDAARDAVNGPCHATITGNPPDYSTINGPSPPERTCVGT